MGGPQPAARDVYLLAVRTNLGEGDLEIGVGCGRAHPDVRRPRAEELRVAGEPRRRVGEGRARRLLPLPQEVVLAEDDAVLVSQHRAGIRVAVRLPFASRPAERELAA